MGQTVKLAKFFSTQRGERGIFLFFFPQRSAGLFVVMVPWEHMPIIGQGA